MKIFKKKNIDVTLKKLDSSIPKNILKAIDEISHYNAIQASLCWWGGDLCHIIDAINLP